MTHRLDWTKVGLQDPDPGAVVEVYDTGGIFCGNDNRPFVPRSRVLALHASRQKQKRAVARKISDQLEVSPEKANLIVSVMQDLGRPPPLTEKSLNRLLIRLLKSGAITKTGEIVPNHALMQSWLTKVERIRDKAKRSATTRAATGLPNTLLP